MGSRADGEMKFSSVLLLNGGGPIYKDVLVAFKWSYSSILDELGALQLEEKCTGSQSYFIPVFSFTLQGGKRGILNVLCKCFLNVYFGILCINRLKETVPYAVAKTLIFHKHFIILAECKEGNLTQKYLNNYLEESFHFYSNKADLSQGVYLINSFQVISLMV